MIALGSYTDVFVPHVTESSDRSLFKLKIKLDYVLKSPSKIIYEETTIMSTILPMNLILSPFMIAQELARSNQRMSVFASTDSGVLVKVRYKMSLRTVIEKSKKE